MRLDAKRRHAFEMYNQDVPIAKIAAEFQSTNREVFSWINYEIQRNIVVATPDEIKTRRARMNADIDLLINKAKEIAQEADMNTKEGRDFFAQASKTMIEGIKTSLAINGMQADPAKGLAKGITEGLTDATFRLIAGLAKPIKEAEVIQEEDTHLLK
jgi:hypothetical protein